MWGHPGQAAMWEGAGQPLHRDTLRGPHHVGCRAALARREGSVKVLEGSEGLAEAAMGCRGRGGHPSLQILPPLPFTGRACLPSRSVPLLRLRRELPLLWAKDKKECRLVSRIIELHSRLLPAPLSGAQSRPPGLRFPLMRIMTRRLSGDSAASPPAGLCWPTRGAAPLTAARPGPGSARPVR